MANIKVGIKFRPILPKESDKDLKWTVNGDKISSVNQKHKLTSENVFDEKVTNEEVYKSLAQPIVIKALDGYNGTVFTYGNTASGKTHTMVGSSKTPGIIPLAAKDIFDTIRNAEDRDFLVRIGYIEIYNDKVFDLFDNRRCGLSIFDFHGETTMDQKDFVVKSEKEVLTYFKIGNNCKRIGQTANNEHSSRSHTVFRITVESQNHSNRHDHKVSNLYLIDLAGSEKPDVSKSSFNEGLHINKSLLALGKIIRELGKKKVNTQNVNFRECKLTRILSPALKGNSLIAVVCTASPVDDETYQTICFSQSLKKVKIYPVLNIANKARMLFQSLKPATPSNREMTIGSSSKDCVNNEIKQLEDEKSKMEENLTNAMVKLEMKQKLIDVLHEKLSEALSCQQTSDEIYKTTVHERGETIKLLEKEVEDNKKLYEYHLESKKDAFTALELSYNDELRVAAHKVSELRKDIGLYQKAVREKEVLLGSMETKVYALNVETSQIKMNYDQRFRELKKHFKSMMKEKDADLKSLNEECKQMQLSADESEIENLNVYIKLEKHYGSMMEDTFKNMEHLRCIVADRERCIDVKNNEIEFLQFQLQSNEQQGIQHANFQRQKFHFILNENTKTFKEIEDEKNSEISHLKTIIEEKNALLDENDKAFKDLVEREIEQANDLKEKFESKIIGIDRNFTEILKEKDEEISKLTQQLNSGEDCKEFAVSDCTVEIETLKNLLDVISTESSVNHHQKFKISTEVKRFFKKLESFVFSSQFNFVPLSPASSLESGIERSPIIKSSLCSHCEQSFSRKYSLDRHMRYKHFSKHE